MHIVISDKNVFENTFFQKKKNEQKKNNNKKPTHTNINLSNWAMHIHSTLQDKIV